MNGTRVIELTKEERELIYYQLSARYTQFEEMLWEASDKKNTARVIEISNLMYSINMTMNKMLGV